MSRAVHLKKAAAFAPAIYQPRNSAIGFDNGRALQRTDTSIDLPAYVAHGIKACGHSF